MEEKIGIINVSLALESMRSNECDHNSFFGESIDNSIEHGASELHVGITTKESMSKGKKPKKIDVPDTLYVADDGYGISAVNMCRALSLGESILLENRTPEISKFGVGLGMSSLANGRRLDVFSRTSTEQKFLHAYIDLDEVAKSESVMPIINPAVEEDVPEEFKKYFEGKTGTLVIVSKLDRLFVDANVLVSDSIAYISRTFRKFIGGGIKMFFNDTELYLHDPLYLAGPTSFDKKEGSLDCKATILDSAKIMLPVPGEPGVEAPVTITMTLLPEEWRRTRGSGGSDFNRMRKIHLNEGVSILREGREVYYGKLPYLIGKKGAAAYLDIDRWWGLEISYPACLDEYFKVRFIKNGIEPKDELKMLLNEMIAPQVVRARKAIKNYWCKSEVEEEEKAGAYEKVENAAQSANAVTRKSKRLPDTDEEDFLKKVDEKLVFNDDEPEEAEKKKKKRLQEIKDKPLTLVPVEYPANDLFEPVYRMGGKITINVNVNHPFYQSFIVPLTGDLSDDENLTHEKLAARDAIYLLFAAYAKASAAFDSDTAISLLGSHLSEMGTVLSTFVNAYKAGE